MNAWTPKPTPAEIARLAAILDGGKGKASPEKLVARALAIHTAAVDALTQPPSKPEPPPGAKPMPKRFPASFKDVLHCLMPKNRPEDRARIGRRFLSTWIRFNRWHQARKDSLASHQSPLDMTFEDWCATSTDPSQEEVEAEYARLTTNGFKREDFIEFRNMFLDWLPAFKKADISEVRSTAAGKRKARPPYDKLRAAIDPPPLT